MVKIKYPSTKKGIAKEINKAIEIIKKNTPNIIKEAKEVTRI